MSSSSPPQSQRRKCCPPNAHPALARDESYELRGHVLQLGPGGGLSVYVTGDAPRGSPGLLVAHDIFGPDSGRTKQLCDVLARRLGVLVVLPDFFRGDPFFPEAYGNSMYSWRSVGESLFDLLIRCRALELLFSSNKRASWEVVGRDFEDICIPLLQERGCRKIGVLGFCWGGWFGCHAASNADICCVAAFHPSLEPCFLVGESSAELCAAVNCPVLMITAGEDSANVKSGGLLSNSIAEKSALLEEQSVFEEFKDMRHGKYGLKKLCYIIFCNDKIYTPRIHYVPQAVRSSLQYCCLYILFAMCDNRMGQPGTIHRTTWRGCTGKGRGGA